MENKPVVDMKKALLIFIIISALTNITKAQKNATPEALIAMAKKLTALKSVSYHYHRYINNIAYNSFSELDGNCYAEFEGADLRIASRFQFESSTYRSIYNGSEFFDLNKGPKTYELLVNPKQESFSSRSFFFNSLQTLRSMIDEITTNDTIPKYQRDTTIDGKGYKLVQANFHMRSLQYLGGPGHFTKDLYIYYKLIINPQTWLPYQILESNNIDKEGYNTKVVFTDINIDPKQPEPYSWFYTTYQKEYQPAKKEIGKPLIASGSLLMDWSLPEYTGKNDRTFKSADVNGKIVLLDFWIKNCGYCMESFPYLQALQKKYGADKFQLLSINAYDPKADIDFFYKREKPAYKMLYTGQAMAKSLGVGSYPTVILLDKNGKVIFSGELDKIKIEALIKANM